MSRLTVPGRILITALILGGLWGLKWLIVDSGYLLKKSVAESQAVARIDLPDAPKNAAATVPQADMPSDKEAALTTPEIRWQCWAWNAQMGLFFANGGPKTTEGSLMAKNNVNLNLIRQDDVPQMQASLIKFASEYKSNPKTTEGIQFVTIMGDGAPSFLAGVNPELEKLGPEYKAQIVYTCGKSLGEDKLMGPAAWRDNPQTAKGGLCAAYLRDGDWNIVVKWCGDNGIKVNPDEKTYDPDAMNFVAADSYIDAAQKYISDYAEDRPVVINGKATGETKHVAVNSVATWTPGDVMIAEKKGGLVSVVSTKEYRSQMPCVVIGIKKWMEDNRPVVENIIDAVAKGGDQVKSYSAALNKAGEISAKIYKEETGPYWVKYYNGVSQADKQGQVVELGGSRVHNLGDNIELFGMGQGSTNVYKIVYTLFGDVAKQLYPKLMPSYPPADDVIDLSYLKAVAARTTTKVDADKVTFNDDDAIRQKVAEKAWNIEFQSGSNKLTPASQKTLESLFNDLVVASNLRVELHGHTDNVGDAAGNRTLSEARAFAVKQWLEQKSPTNFPDGRLSVIAHGSDNPLVPNSTPAGRAKNRRVMVVMGK